MNKKRFLRRLGTSVVALLLSVCLAPIVRAQSDTQEILTIDMPTALRLADERNLDIAIFWERTAEASARLSQARTLAVPTLRVGTSYNRHSGTLQETGGQVVDVDRVSEFRGLGAGAVGAGDPRAAGLSIEVDIADAIFQPLVARQHEAAAEAASNANRHNVLLQVATTYLRLLHARAEMAIAVESRQRALDLATVTADYAESGEGLRADAEMAAIQPLLWEQRRLAAAQAAVAASVALARLLHLDADVRLEPLESTVPIIDIFSAEENVSDLVAQALASRPETLQYDALIGAARDGLTGERYSLLIPKVSLNYSSGDFGGAPGSSVGALRHREDLTLLLYWQLDQLGFGNRGRIQEKQAQLRRVELEKERAQADIVAEVREGYARILSLRKQMDLSSMAGARAQRAYELNRERIYENQGLPLEAMQAMQALSDAQLINLESTVGYSLAQVHLHTVLGNAVGEVR